MYKIVPITALTIANSFISSDKIIQISNDRTKMSIGENDYEHKNKFYLSSCIDNADRSLNSYLSAYDNLSNTYITSSLSDVYITNGNLITRDLIDRILSSDAFLTKDGCKTFEAECIAYITELKNKAVSIIMAKLNESFIKQNSVKRPVYGQIKDGQAYSYIEGILKEENYLDISAKYNFDFQKGEFTLARLLFDDFTMSDDDTPTTQPPTPPTSTTSSEIYRSDMFKDYYDDVSKTYFTNEPFESAANIIENQVVGEDDGFVFNAANQSNFDYKIEVPKASFDFLKNQSIPITKLITYVLKRQIYRALTNICNNYASLMISVPTLAKYGN